MPQNASKTARFLFYLVVFLLLSLILFLIRGIITNTYHKRPSGKPASFSNSPILPEKKIEKPALPTLDKKDMLPIPDSLFLPAPFTPQAPTANWDELHNEACEEAVTIMANAYFSSSSPATLPAEEVETRITRLTDWQDKNLGYHLDATSAETARMMEAVYGLKTSLIENFSETQIKEALTQGKLVAISENGRMLNNPYYKRPGPIHHMLLIKGFQKDGRFLTNDPGTKRGLNYPYSFETLYQAAADWNHSQNNVDLSKKTAILIWK